MDPKNGGQVSSDLQKQAAAAIARKKVLAAYADAASKASNLGESDKSRLKDEPVTSKINSESWKKYHSAWQNYYQKYYSEYYSKAAQDYIAKERLKELVGYRESFESETSIRLDCEDLFFDKNVTWTIFPGNNHME